MALDLNTAITAYKLAKLSDEELCHLTSLTGAFLILIKGYIEEDAVVLTAEFTQYLREIKKMRVIKECFEN